MIEPRFYFVPPAHGHYSAIMHRQSFTWPNAARLAVYLGVNLEHFAFAEGLGAELSPGGPHHDILNYAWRDYGNRVGVRWPPDFGQGDKLVSI